MYPGGIETSRQHRSITPTMVLVKRICPPERRKATIAVTAKPSSPTFSVGSQQPEQFQLRISLRIADTTRPGQAITICTDGTVFAPSDPDDGEFDTLARGTASLTSTADPKNRHINLGHFLIHRARRNPPPPADQKERPSTHLLTIPPEGEVEVAHDLPLSRVFLHESRLKAEDVVGETWSLGLNDGFVGTTWWCWGDMNGELKEKRLSDWHEGMRPESMPKPDVDSEWVLGCNPVELVFENRTEDSTFQFVE